MMRSTTTLDAHHLHGHSLLDACHDLLSRLAALARRFDPGMDEQTISDMRVRRLGVRECNGRALI